MSKQLEWIGTYPTTGVAALASELERQKASRRDYIYPANKLRIAQDGGIVFAGTDTFLVGTRDDKGQISGGTVYTEWSDAEAAANQTPGATIVPLGKQGALPLSSTAERQLAAKLNVPLKYIHDLRGAGHRDLASHNFTTLLERDKRRLLVRTLDGNVRALMSDSYRVMDNGDLFYAAAETFQGVGADLWAARLSEDRFEMLAVSPHIRGEVTTDRTFDPGDGWQSRWHGNEGDVHNAAVRISNSETGEGGLNVSMAVMRKVCANFNVWANGISVIHVGKRNAAEGRIIYSAETTAKESELTWLKIRDAIKTAFDEPRFRAYIDMLNGATRDVIANPEKAVEHVVTEYQITEARKSLILANILRSGDRSRYGLVQAITNTAHSADDEKRPDEASRLEEIGGALIEMPSDRFAALVA